MAMTDSIHAAEPATRPIAIDADIRAKAFGKARRHTGFVKLMRVLLPVLSIGVMVGYGLHAKRKFKVPGGTLQFDGPPIIDTQNLKMLNPKYDGFGKDGSSYDIKAASAQQDLKRTGPILLEAIDGTLTQINNNKIKITATRGQFDQKADTMELQDKIDIKGTDGLSAQLTQATVTIKEHKIVSTQPVQIDMAAGRINGQSMVLLQQKREVYFDGGVTAQLKPEPKAPGKEPKAPAAGAAARTGSGLGAGMMGQSDAPVDITSKALKVDDNAKIATFTTRVVAKQGAATLETNELEAHYAGQPVAGAPKADTTPEQAAAQAEANKGKLKRLVSKGDVVLTQGTDRVTSNTADFDAESDQAVLSGSVVMVSADRRASSDKADLDTRNDKAVLTGNVNISQGPYQHAKSDRADLDNKAETALLTGNVIVDQGRNRLQGRRLAADRKAGNMTLSSPAEAGLAADRISARFYQNEATSGKPGVKKAAPAPQADAGGWSFRTDPGAPIDITSEVLNVVDKNHTATFTGAVHAVQGEFTIKTPELVATYSGQAALAGAPGSKTPGAAAPAGGAQLQKIRANGKVEVTSATQSATGDWAEFDVKGNKVTIGANAGKMVKLKKGDSHAESPKVVIDMLTGITTLEQLERVAQPAPSRKNPQFVPGQLPDIDPTLATADKATVPAYGANSDACPPGRTCVKFDPKDGAKPGETKPAAPAKQTVPAKPAAAPAGGGWSMSAPQPGAAKPAP
jgi:hypothetical protein